MISARFRFEAFAEAIEGKEFFDVIYRAEQEAISAWREAHPSKELNSDDQARSREYQEKLLGLIHYMRHGVLPNGFDERDSEICDRIRSATG